MIIAAWRSTAVIIIWKKCYGVGVASFSQQVFLCVQTTKCLDRCGPPLLSPDSSPHMAPTWPLLLCFKANHRSALSGRLFGSGVSGQRSGLRVQGSKVKDQGSKVKVGVQAVQFHWSEVIKKKLIILWHNEFLLLHDVTTVDSFKIKNKNFPP